MDGRQKPLENSARFGIEGPGGPRAEPGTCLDLLEGLPPVPVETE